MNRSSARPAASPRGPLDWLLSLFADVRGGEGLTAFLLMIDVFLLLGCYYIIKPVREALIIAGSGAVVKSYASAAMVVALIFMIPAYSALASRVNRTTLLTAVTGFFIACLVAFYFLAIAGTPYLDIVFFVWVGIFNVTIIAQFWSFANDIYDPEQGKRLFAVIAIGSALGAIVGATIFENVVDPEKSAPGVVYRMMLVAAGVLTACLFLTRFISARTGVAHGTPAEAAETREKPLDSRGGFRLIFSDRYLVAIAFLMLVVNFVNTNGEYLLGQTLENTAKEMVAAGRSAGLPAEEFQKQFIGNYYAGFYKWVNWISALSQMFLVSRFIKWFGVRAGLFVLPLIALGGYGMLAVAPVLAIIRKVKIAENATDYSLQNTVRHALFLPTSREAKYKAKQATDTFFWRAGDVLSAVLVYIGTQLTLSTRNFALVNVVMVLVWLALCVAIARIHGAREGRVPAPGATPQPA